MRPAAHPQARVEHHQVITTSIAALDLKLRLTANQSHLNHIPIQQLS
jgi:hypothetical protein